MIEKMIVVLKLWITQQKKIKGMMKGKSYQKHLKLSLLNLDN